MSQQNFAEVVNTEHISDRDGENINAKRIGLYGYDYGNSQWRRLAVSSGGSLLSGTYVPYTGATNDIDLNTRSLTMSGGDLTFDGGGFFFREGSTMYFTDPTGATNHVQMDASANSVLSIRNTGNVQADLNFGSIASTTKTFTFPNTSGTLALTSDLHSAVTLAGETYLSLSGQQITAADINLTTHVTGTLAVGNGGTGLTTLATGRIPYGNGSGAFSSSGDLVTDGNNLSVGFFGILDTAVAGMFYKNSSAGGGGNGLYSYFDLTGGNTASFPISAFGQFEANSGANSIFFGVGLSGRANIATTQTGNVNSLWGALNLAWASTTTAITVDSLIGGEFSAHLVGATAAATIAINRGGLFGSFHNTSAPGAVTQNFWLWAGGNIPAGGIGTQYGIYVGQPARNTGHATNSYQLYLEASAAITANNQIRYGAVIGAMPSPGAFTGVTNNALAISGTSRTTRDSIIFAGDTSAVIYTSASATIDVTGAFKAATTITAGTTVTATTSVIGTTSVITPLVNASDTVTLLVRGGTGNAKQVGGNLTMHGGASGGAGAGVTQILEPDGTTEVLGVTDGSGLVINEGGDAAVDFRVEGDTLSHMIFTDATGATENIALVAAAAPNWQSGDRQIFIGEVSTAPTGNPTAGGFLYVEGGALKYRGTSGTITTMGPA